MNREYAIRIQFQGNEYLSVERFPTFEDAAMEAQRRFGIGGAVSWKVEAEREP